MGKIIAKLLQAKKLSDGSNEVHWREGFAVIKCCRPRTTSFGVTSNMLMRIDAILVVCEREDGDAEVFELTVADFRHRMIDSRSAGAAGGKVKQVSKSTAQRDGRRLRSFSAADILS